MRHFFPLTSLQIGDLQSYLAELTIFLCPHTKKFLILLDNRPWLLDQDTKPAHLWQLMVTKSRFSPFANSRTRRKRDETGGNLVFSANPISAAHLRHKPSRWYSLIDEAMREKKLQVNKLKDARILNRELHQTLYGFIIFEVDWADVRGINYLNELQTDTSMAVESKIMKRWEFDSVNQASSLITSWFSGNESECQLLQDYLDSISSNGDVFYDARNYFLTPEWENSPSDSDDPCHVQIIRETSSFTDPSYTPPPCSGPYKRRKIIKFDDGSSMSEESYSEIVTSPKYSSSSCSSCGSDDEGAKPLLEPSTYKDVLICFRFDDHDLPFRLKEVILSDVRLLTLLEYGLPSWVIFLQSYPVFCKIYRPWMCPLARALYVLMSLVTVLIGFYDLYKNVPMLKATASRLFGPFFDWIETWEMISRLKYLGTMLFLHNFQQAFTWSLKIVHAVKSALSVLTKPIAAPILEIFEFTLPMWNFCAETVEYLSSAVMVSLETSWSVFFSTMQMIFWPFWFVSSIVVNIVNSVMYPVIWLLGEILAAPFRLVIGLSSFVVDLFVDIVSVLRQSWSTLSALYQAGSVPRSHVLTSDNSIWGSLWKDLLYQIFRALRSILYGFVAFFSTCNRHRLSIYNHIQVFLRRLSQVSTRGHEGDKASENLFSWLEDSVLRRPTYSRFCALLDNYNPHQGYKESVTQQDKHEETAFIEEISRSAPIKYLHRYLVLKEAASQDYEEFKKMLASLWFDLCGRGGCSSSSSAFEHVFVGEIKGRRQGEDEVSGFHNWIQFYLEESNGNVDYQGYIFPRRRGELPDSETQLLTIQFEWHGVLKSVSSTLIGVSPEFEIALYTLCFFAGGEDNHVDIGPYSVNIKCYRLGGNKIGSAFPIAEN